MPGGPVFHAKQKAISLTADGFGRSDGIRTHGLLVPNQARYQLRYTPIKKPQQRGCCGFWLGMRGSNSHGRSQSPLHYHYANPHRACEVASSALPSTVIYYSGRFRVCQQLFAENFQKIPFALFCRCRVPECKTFPCGFVQENILTNAGDRGTLKPVILPGNFAFCAAGR